MRISIVYAKPGMKLADNVYKSRKVLLRAGTVLTPATINALKKRGILEIEVESERDMQALAAGSQEVDIISEEIRLKAEQTIKDIWEEVRNGGRIHIARVRSTVETILEDLSKRNYTFLKLADIRALDNYTFTHSVNVCVLALNLGIASGYTEAELLELGTGALLHDLGKVIIPGDVLNKPGPLNEKEIEIVRKHPAHGFHLLSQEPEIGINAALIPYEHHERYQGDGYPRGLRGDAIHKFAQLVAIADVYDSLTSDRSYRSKLKPYEAVEILIAMSGQGFNPKLVNLLLDNVEIYPVGCIVELNDGSLAVVTSVNKMLPIRPKVRKLVRHGESYVPSGDEMDLMENPTVFITRVISLNWMSRGGAGSQREDKAL